MSKSTIEEVVTLDIESGNSTGKVRFELPAGEIIRCAIFAKSAAENPSMVRASIKTIGGEDICRLQCIENYRDREGDYIEGKKPISIEGGKSYVYEIIADTEFTEKYLTDLIIVYKDQNKMC